jgi:hypothetical protein
MIAVFFLTVAIHREQTFRPRGNASSAVSTVECRRKTCGYWEESKVNSVQVAVILGILASPVVRLLREPLHLGAESPRRNHGS